MNLKEAEDLAARTLAAIDAPGWTRAPSAKWRDADRERVASDLAGLRRHSGAHECVGGYAFTMPCDDAQDRIDGLRRTAALYGVT